MKPKVLLIDIETSPIEAFVWSLHDQNVSLPQVKTDWNILSWCAKWLGEKGVFYQDLSAKKNKRDDRPLLKKIWELLDEADIVIGQNSNDFDLKKLNARFIQNRMQPPNNFKKIDTLKLARKHFGFTSNKLAHLTDILCTKYKKLEHKDFPGLDMWKECLSGNPKAWASMKKYNIHDVLSLEELYTKLIPWDSSVNFTLYDNSPTHTCSCGSIKIHKKGYSYTSVGVYQRYRCMDCGAQTYGGKNLYGGPKHKNAVR